MNHLVSLLIFVLVFFSAKTQVYILPDSLENAPYDKVIQYLDTRISKQTPWNRQQIELTLCKANWLTKNWQYEEAFEVFRSIPQDKAKSQGLIGDYFLMHAILLKYNNEPELAFTKFRGAIAFFKAKGSLDKMCFTRIELTEFYRKIGQLSIALQELEAITHLFDNRELSKNSNLYLKLLNRKAAVLNESSQLKSSIELSKKSITLAQELNDRLAEAISSNEIGFSFKNLEFNRSKNLDTCIFYYQKSEQLYRQLGMECEALQVKYNWITAYSHNRKYPKLVIQGYLEIIEEVKRRNIDFLLRDVYRNLSTEYEIKGDYINALKFNRLCALAGLDWSDRQKAKEVQKIKDEYTAFQLKTENQSIKRANIQKDKELSSQKSQNQIYIVLLIILLGLILSLFLFFRKNRKLSANLLVKNKEKDVLIQEVHHRVKNNMQFISTLLEMQQNSSKHVNESIVLQDAHVRIESMSLVHEMLYQDENLSEIDLSDYSARLLDHLKDSFNIQENEVLVNLQVPTISISTDQATSIGLIINEFFSNSVKHAFFTTENPEFNLIIKKNKNDIQLDMWDNGPGTQEVIESSRSLGVKLIRLLTNQLKATGTWNTTTNFHYSITIPL